MVASAKSVCDTAAGEGRVLLGFRLGVLGDLNVDENEGVRDWVLESEIECWESIVVILLRGIGGGEAISTLGMMAGAEAFLG
jgi:hypothetical protein